MEWNEKPTVREVREVREGPAEGTERLTTGLSLLSSLMLVVLRAVPLITSSGTEPEGAE